MATRGSAVLITEEFVAIGPEFNGDMYPHGQGDNFLKGLSEVENNTEFIIFNNRFNKYNFGYDKIMSNYQGKFDNKDIMNGKNYSAKLLSKRDGEFGVTSDWVFIKNATDKQIRLNDVSGKTININSKETIRLYFGHLVDKGKGHRIKQ